MCSMFILHYYINVVCCASMKSTSRKQNIISVWLSGKARVEGITMKDKDSNYFNPQKILFNMETIYIMMLPYNHTYCDMVWPDHTNTYTNTDLVCMYHIDTDIESNIAFARGGAHLPIAHALRLLFLDEIEIEKK